MSFIKGQALKLKLIFVTKMEGVAEVNVDDFEPNLILEPEGFLEYRYPQNEKMGVFKVNIDD